MAVAGNAGALPSTQSSAGLTVQISLDCIDRPALVIGSGGRIRYANAQALKLLDDLNYDIGSTEVSFSDSGPTPPGSDVFETSALPESALQYFRITSGRGSVSCYVGHAMPTWYEQEYCSLCLLAGPSRDMDILRQALDMADLGVWMWNVQTELVLWSEQVYRMFGIDSANHKLDFESFLGRVRRKDRERVEKLIRQSLSSGSYEAEFEIQRPDKTYRSLRTRAFVQYSPTGLPLFMVGTCQDMTEDRKKSRLLEQLVAVLDQSPDMVAVLDVRGQAIFMNEAGREFFGNLPVNGASGAVATEAENFGQLNSHQRDIGQFIRPYHPDWAFEKIISEAMPVANKGQIWTDESAVLDANGTEVPVEQHIIGHRDPDSGEIMQFSTIMRDLRPQKQATATIERVNSLMNAVADSVSDGFWVRREHQVLYANVALGEIFGISPYSICRKPDRLLDFFADKDRSFIASLFHEDVAFDTICQRECVIEGVGAKNVAVKVSAYPCIFPAGEAGCVVTLVDISRLKETQSALLAANAQLSRFAMQDSLTGIANRRALLKTMKHEIARGNRYRSDFCLILFDLDHFKKVNDRFGHDVGDQVLKSVSQVLRSRLRTTDTLGRWGGEEFLILLPGTTAEQAKCTSEHLRCLIQNGFQPGKEPITASFGVAELCYGESHEDLLNRADCALYEAKAGGRNRVCMATTR